MASGAESQITATPEDEPREDGPKEKVEKPWRKWAKKVLALVIVVLALWGAYEHRSEISSAGSMFSQLKVAWLLLAIVAELASMVVFARLQRWLLRAGGVQVPFVPMVEITLAGNAMSTTLPGRGVVGNVEFRATAPAGRTEGPGRLGDPGGRGPFQLSPSLSSWP